MNKKLTGLFLGAGASYEAGLPVVWELTGEIRDWLTPEKLRELNKGWRSQGTGCSDEVIEDFVSVLVMPDAHYENMLGYLETQYRRKRERQNEYRLLYSWMVELVYVLLCQRQIKNDVFLRRKIGYFEGIRFMAEENTPLWVFSLNHDVVIEAIAAHYSIPINFGFSDEQVSLPCRGANGKVKGRLNAQVLRRDTLDNCAMFFPNPAVEGIYLLKLHGALDVFAFNDGADLLKLMPVGEGFEGVTEALRAVNEDVFFPEPASPNGRANIMNEIAYADDEGVMQFLRRSLLAGAFKFSDANTQVLPKSLLKHFRANINFLSKLVCVGYGFGDNHINVIIREWLEFSDSRSLEVVGPAASVPAFLMHVAPQVTVVQMVATDYFDLVAGVTRPRCDELDKKVSAVVRSRGRAQAKADLAAFGKQESERYKQLHIESLARIYEDGKGTAVGDVLKEYVPIAVDDEEATLERMLSFIEARVKESEAGRKA
ncbi:hypothetical protein [Stutzerimonas nitrititolerans]|uniref:hypothetical protein n=1 Tax=Stutzerimonas nitrititolerans TaxID=2482751 RepID=UPI0028AD2275|nr:hypothetical protein [Stutzerimonas nitrititolerans]